MGKDELQEAVYILLRAQTKSTVPTTEQPFIVNGLSGCLMLLYQAGASFCSRDKTPRPACSDDPDQLLQNVRTGFALGALGIASFGMWTWCATKMAGPSIYGLGAWPSALFAQSAPWLSGLIANDPDEEVSEKEAVASGRGEDFL